MKILIVDDDAALNEEIHMHLREQGHVVSQALDGHEALTKIKEMKYDIIFMDLKLPIINGLDLIRYIKENKVKAKVVVITGYVQLYDSIADPILADDCLTKPFDLNDVDGIIQKLS